MTTIQYKNRYVQVEYNYIPEYNGSYLDPPNPEGAEITKVELSGRDITKYVDLEEIEKILLEQINY